MVLAMVTLISLRPSFLNSFLEGPSISFKLFLCGLKSIYFPNTSRDLSMYYLYTLAFKHSTLVVSPCRLSL